MRFFGQGFLDAVYFNIPGNLQRRLINYALTRFLGSFVKVDVASDELQLSLSKGKVVLTNIDLRTDAINDRLEDSGLALKSGLVNRLEIVIPWSNILSGKFIVLLGGLNLVVTPSVELSDLTFAPAQTKHLLVESVADIAKSFLSDEVSEEPSGVADGASDYAIYQRLLGKLLSNLCIEISQFQLCIEKSTGSDLFLDIAAIRVEPSATEAAAAAAWELSIQGLEGYLSSMQEVDTSRDEQNTSAARPLSTTSNSDSVSTESNMTHSTILDNVGDRSMYMSAVSDLPMTDESGLRSSSAVIDHLLRRSRFLHCETSITGSLLISEDSTALEISCGPVTSQLSRLDFLSVWASIQGLLAHIPATDTQPVEMKHRMELHLKLESFEGELHIANVDATNTSHGSSDEIKSLRSSARHLVFNYCTFQDLTIMVPYFRLALNDSYLSSAEGSVNFGTFILDTKGSLRGTLEALMVKLDLEQVKNILPVLETLCEEMTSRGSRRQTSSQTPSQTLTTFAQLTCPAMNIYCTGSHDLAVSVSRPTLNLQESSQKSRGSLSFDTLEIAIDGHAILDLTQLTSANVIDYTKIKLKSPQPTLEFINYETLFEHRERDQKAEQNTLNALKEKSNAQSDYTIRASLGKCSGKFDELKIKLVISALHYLTTFMSRDLDKNSLDVQKSGTIKMTLAELAELQLTLSLHERQSMKLSLHRLSYFQVTNIKHVDVVALNIGDVLLVSVDRFGDAFPIFKLGLHVVDQNSRSLPMIAARYRRSCRGKRIGLQMLRIAFTDMQFAYRAEMPWVDSVHKLYDDVAHTGRNLSDDAEESLHVPAKLAIDLNNVSVELNPYLGKSKGLLYFRKSLLEGSLPFTNENGSTRFHAGVVDFFLIDNTDCAQNETSDHKLQQKDIIGSTMLKVGFIKVANMETAEIVLSLRTGRANRSELDLNIIGAIVTLHTCADSFATLVNLASLLRLPVSINDNVKYKLNTINKQGVALDIFANIDDYAFTTKKPMVDCAVGDRQSPNSSPSDISRDSNDVTTNYSMSQTVADLRSPSLLATANYAEKKLLTVKTQRCFVVWNIHDGYDWASTRSKITRAVERALDEAQASAARQHPSANDHADKYFAKDESDTESSDEVGDLLFNSIYIALPAGAQREDVARAINDEIAVADFSDSATQTTTTTRGQHARRSMAHDSPGLLQLGRSKAHKVRIEISELDVIFKLFQVDISGVMANTKITIQDLEIIDNVSTSTWNKFLSHARGTRHRAGGQPMIQISIVNVKPLPIVAAAELAIEAVIGPLRLHVDQDTLEFLTRFFEFRDEEVAATLLPADEIFFQKIEIQAIPIQIDYKPKRLDFKSLRSGRTTELKNLFILEESNMTLKHVVLYGINGVNRVSQNLNDIWLSHIKTHQLSSVLAGVSAVRSVANFGGGLKKLVMEPIADYQKDGRLMPGLKRGINSFVRTTGNEAVRLGAKLAVGTQGMLESAEHAFRDTPSDPRLSRETHAVSMYADQPNDLRQGISQAIDGMSRHVGVAKDALSSLPRELEEETDARKAAGVAAKSIPVAVLRPLIGTTEMISKTLLGLRNSLNPEQKRLNDDKYKHRN